MNYKKMVILLVWCLGLLGVSIANKVLLEPLFSDWRFPPIDKLHSSCINSSKVYLQLDKPNFDNIHLNLWYNPDEIQILRIIPNSSLSNNYSMEYNKVVFDVSNDQGLSSNKVELFEIYFKNSENVNHLKLDVLNWSYSFVKWENKVQLSQSFNLDFEDVPECNPDIIPPILSLISPDNVNDRLSMDQYFVFDIKDIWKWVDTNSLIIKFDGETYSATDYDNVKWNGNYLVFYPKEWLPINKNLNLEIVISDKQIYWWANTTKRIFSFRTNNEISLQNDMDPNTFRKMAKWAEKIYGSLTECQVLQGFYSNPSLSYKNELKSVLDKLMCSVQQSTTNQLDIDQNHAVAPDKADNGNIKYVSVFAAIWWLLFVIVFVLKLHYMASYRKHKKMAKLYQGNMER